MNEIVKTVCGIVVNFKCLDTADVKNSFSLIYKYEIRQWFQTSLSASNRLWKINLFLVHSGITLYRNIFNIFLNTYI